MKKFSRASLVALGTAAAITAASFSAPAFADEANDTAFAGSSDILGDADKATDSIFEGSSADNDDKDGEKLDLSNLTDWIKVIGSIVDVLGDILNLGK